MDIKGSIRHSAEKSIVYYAQISLMPNKDWFDLLNSRCKFTQNTLTANT